VDLNLHQLIAMHAICLCLGNESEISPSLFSFGKLAAQPDRCGTSGSPALPKNNASGDAFMLRIWRRCCIKELGCKMFSS